VRTAHTCHEEKIAVF